MFIMDIQKSIFRYSISRRLIPLLLLVAGVVTACGTSSTVGANVVAVGSGIIASTTMTAKDCPSNTVHCVNVVAGATQEFTSIQSAVAVATPGDSILVFDGVYDGFQIGKGSNGVRVDGTSSQSITIQAAGDAAIINTPYIDPSSDIYKVATRACGIAVLFGGDYWVVDGLTIDLATENEITSAGYNPQIPASTSDIGGINGYHRGGICNDGHMLGTNNIIGLQLLNNTVANGGDSNIIIANCESCLWANNIVHDSYRIGSQGGHGIYLANPGSDNSTIRGNTIYNNDGIGIHMNGDGGLITNALVENNIIYDNGHDYADSNGGVGVNMDGVQDSTIRNNLIYSNFYIGIKAYGVDGIAGPKNLTVVNNTVITSKQFPLMFMSTSAHNDQGGHTLFNNIFLDETNDKSISVATYATGLISNNNIIAVGTGSSFGIGDTKSVLTHSEWIGSTGQDVNTRASSSSILFLDSSSDDYHLAVGSLAVDMGLMNLNGQNAPTQDSQGISHSVQDVGAYAY